MGRFRIGYRTLKTAVGTAISVYIAQLLQLDYYISAGVITILCITTTKRGSLTVSIERLVSCVIGLGVASVFFELIGYNPVAIAALFLISIPLSVAANAARGIVTSSVIVLHLYTEEQVSAGIWINELAIIFIGIGVALIMNLYMPSSEKSLAQDQLSLEDAFRKIWEEYANYLRFGDNIWDGAEFSEAAKIIDEAKGKALRDIDNHFLRDDDYFYHYFRMREKQFSVLESILPFISSIDQSVPQGHKMADYMDELSDAVSPGNTAGYFLYRLDEMKHEIQQMELPKTRHEFEIRSSLFYILYEIEEYLLIKKMFKPDPKRTHTISGKRLNRQMARRNK